MDILLITVIITGTIYRIEAADSFDVNKVGELVNAFDQTYQKVGNTRTSNAGLNRNLYKNNINIWLTSNGIYGTNGLTQKPFTPQRNGFNYNTMGNYGTNLLWNRPTSRPNYNKVTASTDDIDPAVAEQFPELVDLLNRLKELNKLKEEGKLPNGENKPDGLNNKPNNGNNNHKNNGTVIIPDDKDKNNNTKGKPEYTGTNAVVLADGKVYFQAQPVVPENERIKMNETIFYINS